MIVLFWLMTNGEPAHYLFRDDELSHALKAAERHRRQGMRHVTISSEMSDQVGQNGVTSVEDGKTPDGQDYEWSKKHRGEGPDHGTYVLNL